MNHIAPTDRLGGGLEELGVEIERPTRRWTSFRLRGCRSAATGAGLRRLCAGVTKERMCHEAIVSKTVGLRSPAEWAWATKYKQQPWLPCKC
jgi:hypothetical protein